MTRPPTLASIRGTRPVDADHLWHWVRQFLGVKVPRVAVCEGHSAPFDLFAEQVLRRPSISLWHGPRGAGKSFLSALDTHLTSRFNPRHGTRILGGSRAQSEQIYRAIREAVIEGSGPLGTDQRSILKLLKTEATYRNGSEVSILAASPTSVRGPHVPSLKLDEVDEIDPDIRESAVGMAKETRGQTTSILMTSTWHRVGGPMGELKDRASDPKRGFPWHTFCVFEALERCPEERSGRHLEKCPECPIVRWCHSDIDRTGLPKAKRADGHYSIDSLIQKATLVSGRVFESDYLCLGPRAAGLWFTRFDDSNVSAVAEYDPLLPVHLAIDSGVFTGAVFFQVRGQAAQVFADFLTEGQTAESNARQLIELARQRCHGRLDVISTDPAGGARNPIGPSVIAEYERSSLRPLLRWPIGPVADSLALLESFVRSADGTVGLVIHPRCVATVQAMKSYRRAKRGGQWQDYPEDPQHPFEDLVDALRGGLKQRFPEGRKPEPKFARVRARNLF